MKAWGNLLSFAWAADGKALFVVAGVRDGGVWFYPWIFKGTRIHWGKIQSEIGPNLGANCAANAVSEAHENEEG